MPSAELIVTGQVSIKRYKIVGLANQDTLVMEHSSYIGLPSDAVDERKLAGDLLFDTSTGDICTEDSWLWDWERDNPLSYAWKMMQAARWRAENGRKPRWHRSSQRFTND